MIYATTDSEDGRISSSADILAFETEAAAREYLLSAYPTDEWDHATAVIEPGRFGDCWIKVHSAPGDDEPYFAPFTRDDLIILAPGQHPGGKAWWIEPRERVLIVASISERA